MSSRNPIEDYNAERAERLASVAPQNSQPEYGNRFPFAGEKAKAENGRVRAAMVADLNAWTQKRYQRLATPEEVAAYLNEPQAGK
jgi:hypothetical protein